MIIMTRMTNRKVGTAIARMMMPIWLTAAAGAGVVVVSVVPGDGGGGVVVVVTTGTDKTTNMSFGGNAFPPFNNDQTAAMQFEVLDVEL